MKLLQDKVNVNAPDADFPFGDLRDDDGTGNGTPANRELFTDALQFFEKIISESGVVANGLPDNDYNGWQLYEAFRKLARPGRLLRGLISQSGTSAPTLTVLGIADFTPVLARTNVGEYTITLTGEFLAAKTWYQIGTGVNGGLEAFLRRVDDDELVINTKAASVASDSVLDNTPIEIWIYD